MAENNIVREDFSPFLHFRNQYPYPQWIWVGRLPASAHSRDWTCHCHVVGNCAAVTGKGWTPSSDPRERSRAPSDRRSHITCCKGWGRARRIHGDCAMSSRAGRRWAGKETCMSSLPASTLTAQWQTAWWHSRALSWQPISKVQTAKRCMIRDLAERLRWKRR